MEYEHGGWIIDATPDFSLGKFFAHARLSRSSPERGVGTEKHIEGDLAWFDTEAAAIQVAHQWALDWIDKCESSAVTT